jgi:hypothetical protein
MKPEGLIARIQHEYVKRRTKTHHNFQPVKQSK